MLVVSLTVFFEDPFWVGVFERINSDEQQLEVSHVTFGSEPKDYEVLEYLQKSYYKLKFSPPVQIKSERPISISIKRLKKEAKKETSRIGTSSKSQEAMRLQLEAQKKQKTEISKAALMEEKERKFLIHQMKKKEKKRGH